MLLRSGLPLLISGLTAPAAADVVSATDTGFATRGAVSVPASPAAVWAELLVPAKWWDPAHTWSGDAANLTLDARATGCFCERLPAGAGPNEGSVEHLHVTHVAPGRLLRLTGGLGPLQAEPVSAVLSVSLSPDGKGTRIVFEYRVAGLTTLKGGAIAEPVDGVLTAQLARLAARFAGAAPPAR